MQPLYQSGIYKQVSRSNPPPAVKREIAFLVLIVTPRVSDGCNSFGNVCVSLSVSLS